MFGHHTLAPRPSLAVAIQRRPRLSLLPDEAPVPRWTHRGTRLPVIVDGHRRRSAGGQRRNRREEGVPVPPIRDPLAALHHAVHLERHLQVDLHLGRRLERAIRDRVPAANAAVGRTHGDVEVVEGRVPPRAPGAVASAKRVGVGEDSGRPLCRRVAPARDRGREQHECDHRARECRHQSMILKVMAKQSLASSAARV